MTIVKPKKRKGIDPVQSTDGKPNAEAAQQSDDTAAMFA